MFRQFSVKSEYRALGQDNWEEAQECWSCIWKLQVPTKIKTFLWLTRKEALLTNNCRFRRHIASSPNCDLCAGKEEDWIHVLRNFLAAYMVWSELDPSGNLANFVSKNLKN